MSFILSRSLSRILLRHINPLEIFGNWWSSPFNGQAKRLNNLYVLSSFFSPTKAIETGTFMGSSTYIFLGIPSVTNVFSFESNQKYYDISAERYQSLQSNRVNFILGDSKIEFAGLLSRLDANEERLVCYLDAHWEGDIPTSRELLALGQWGGEFLAIIDDFKVDNSMTDLGYGYDQYRDLIVDISIVPTQFDFAVYVPKEDSSLETGSKRGTAYVLSKGLMTMISKSLFNELGLTRLQY